MKTVSLDNRIIRVFISSTFRDMQDERDELMKKTFPVLRQKAAERDVTLTELDLRWGITPEESESGRVVEICLREIENSKPFFVGIIGNRYGWIPTSGDMGESLRERFSQVDGYVERHLSVTEMEMQFGVLERSEDMHAFFFIKEQETDDADEPEKLAALKAAVRSNDRYPVSTYSSPEDLASQVEEAFTKLMDDLYPEGALSELEKERIGQRAYLNSLCQNYIRSDSNFATINEWMTDWKKHQLVITGASGLGKSALVANWVKEKLAAGDELPYRIIYHFVGNGGSLGSHGHVIKVLCDEIRDQYGFDTDNRESRTDEKALEELFNRVAAEGDKPLLIVLDAINQIIDINNSKQLNWLPIPPKKVKILFTTLADDRTMDVFKNRHYPVFTLLPLTREQRKEMIQGYLGRYSKKLQPHQVERIVTDKQCENTLVLKTTLDELVNFGIFEKLDEKISTYLGASSVEEFYGILLKGYESDFSEPLVRHILSLIAVSRNGLSEEEIIAITQETPLHWSQFFCAIHQHLIIKNGLISFAHSYIRKAVEHRYLQGKEEWSNACRTEIVSFFNDAKTHRAMDELPYQYDQLGDLERLHNYLMDMKVFVYFKEHAEIELGFYWRRLIEKGYSLSEYKESVQLYRGDVIAGLLKLLDFVLLTVVDSTMVSFFSEIASHYIDHNEPSKYNAELFERIGLACMLNGTPKEAIQFHKKALAIRTSLFGDCDLDVSDSFNNLGCAYYELGDYKKGAEYHRRALDIRRKLFGDNHLSTATSYDNLASCANDPQEELLLLEKALKIRQGIEGDDGSATAVSFNNLGVYYGLNEEYDKAFEYLNKALNIQLRMFGNDHPRTAMAYRNLAFFYCQFGNDNKALDAYKKVLKCCLACYGESHKDTAEAYHQIGTFKGRSGNYKEALDYQLKALQIRSTVCNEDDDSLIDSYDHIGHDYYALRVMEKAFAYQSKALELQVAFRGENDSRTPGYYISIGNTLCALMNYPSAIEHYNKALLLYHKLYGKPHPDIVHLLNTISDTFWKQVCDPHRAIEYKQKALDTALSVFGERHLEVAAIYHDWGCLLSQTGKHTDGLAALQKALSIRVSLYGEKHPSVAFSLNNIGCALSDLENYLGALDSFKKAQDILISCYGENHPRVVDSFANLGYVYAQLKDFNKSSECLLKGFRIADLNHDMQRTASFFSQLGSIYKSDGHKETANDYFRQAAKQYHELGDEEQAEANLKEIIE